MSNYVTIQRRYPNYNNWDYKAISTIITEGNKAINVIYHICNNDEGIEVFTGKNYIVGAKNNSYSKRYNINNLPTKYKNIVENLKTIHNKTEWSNESYVNNN